MQTNGPQAKSVRLSLLLWASSHLPNPPLLPCANITSIPANTNVLRLPPAYFQHPSYPRQYRPCYYKLGTVSEYR